mmetsp:Transcript_58229/g.62910  ORF Transcript_58229/g.62910 Transcript_58229/m.62910 type:complete len:303 (+) Transcript_58229:2161-3069(+)
MGKGEITREQIVNHNSSSSSAAASSSSSSLSVSQQMDRAKSLISTAISIGAPAYNTGDIPECARIYKETALQIAPMLPQNLQTGLEATIQQTFKNANEEAWAFRKNFDSIIDYQITFVPSSSETMNVTTLEPFTDSNMIPSQPCVVDDNVMGGVSQGNWLSASNTFRGRTSLANNGGFSSLRWRFDRIQNWMYAKGIYLKVWHSDPSTHTFRVILKDTTCEQVRLSNFKNVFCNPNLDQKAGDANPIFIPFDSFDQMEQMGRRLSPGQVFNRAEVTELGLMAIKPSVVGEFELHIEEWGLYL